VSLLEQLAEFSQSAGEYGSALDYYEQILRIAEMARESSGILSHVLLRMAVCQSQTGDYARAVEILDRAFANLPADASDVDVSRILNEKAFALLRMGNYAQAEECVRRITERILKPDSGAQLARAQNSFGAIAMWKGNWEEAGRSYEAALATYRLLGDRDGIAQCLNNLGLMEKNRGNNETALRHLREALRIAEEVGDTYYVGVRLNNMGLLEFKLGAWEDARRSWERAVRLLESIGNRWEVANILLNLGNYYRHKRDWDEADALYLRAQAIVDELGEARERILVKEFRGDLALSSESYDEARSFFELALTEARALAPEGDVTLEVLRRLADLDSRVGHLAEAKQQLQRGFELSAHLEEETERGVLLRIRARLEGLEGEIATAEDSYRESIDLLQRYGTPFELAVTRLELATFCIEQIVDLDDAERQLDLARETFEKVGAEYEAGHAYLMKAKLEMANEHPSPNARVHLETAIDLLERVGSEEDRSRLREVNGEIDRLLEETSLSARNELAALNEAVGRLLGASEGTARVRAIEHALHERLGADRAALLLVKGEGGGFDLAPGSSLDASQGREVLALVDSIRGERPLGPKPFVSTSPARDPRFNGASRTVLAKLGSVLFIPLFSEEELLGGLYADRCAEAGYIRQPEIDFFVAFATAAAMSVQDMRLEAVRLENARLRRELAGRNGFHGIITQNRRMLEILDLIERLRLSSTTVLLQGETGTGKELLAEALHQSSSRRTKQLVTINCAAISRDVLESELFGHVRGAFTDAKTDKVGLFERADGGTIFLDEIDKTSREFQERLLRVVDQGEIKPVGANQVKRIDVRILCASNRPLREEVEGGRFLKDLYYRLRVISIDLPPLRDRKEDVPLLVDHFLRHFAEKSSKKIAGVAPEAMTHLIAHSWPGNVRDLRHEIERAVAMSDDGALIRPEHLSPEIRPTRSVPSLLLGGEQSLPGFMEEIERDLVVNALEKTAGNRSHAAKLLGISRRGLLNKIARYAINL
jgi:transcriptional regulator with GAF, ATPase, and Fis domain/Tfp pilus assembly protein PilF